MNKRKLASYRKLLANRKSDLLKQVITQDDDIDELREDQPADPLDMAGNTSSLELMIAVGNNERVELSEIDRALEKIEGGDYGKCEDCEEDIAPARLEAIPTARLCVGCKEKQEMNPRDTIGPDRPRRRAILTDDLSMNSDEQ